MAGGKTNEPTTDKQVLVTRTMFERDIQKGDRPPYYFDREGYVAETQLDYKDFGLPFDAGRCRITWPEDKWKFEWS